MKRTTLIAGGLGCLVAAAFFLKHPLADPSAAAGSSPQTRPTDSAVDMSLKNQGPPLTQARVAAEEPGAGKDAWLNALTSLEFAPFDQAAPVIARALQNPDRDVRLRAVLLLAGARDNSAILPLLGVAQADADAEVRRDAIGALAYSPLQENLTPYLLRGALDMDADVREAVVQTAWSLAPAQRDDFIAQSLNSTRPEIASAAFGMLAHEASAKTISLLLGVYATNDGARIQQANEVMSRLVGETFDNATEAANWWREHQAEYGDDLASKTSSAAADP